MQRLAVEIIDDVEETKSPPAVQRVAHKVGRPDRVRVSWHVERNAFPFGQPSLGGATKIQPHELVHPVDPLVVPRPALSPKLSPTLPETAVRMPFHKVRQLRNDFGIPNRPIRRMTVASRSTQIDHSQDRRTGTWCSSIK